MLQTKVMVVEDESVVALNLCQRLRKLGYEVPIVVSSGADALAQIQVNRPDIVLMDIHIEGDMDGIETASQIPSDWMLPVIYLTAYSEESTLDRAQSTRPYGYLLKPFSERELHATIKMALERRASDVAMHESEERLRLTLTAAEMGSWEIDPDSLQIHLLPYGSASNGNENAETTQSLESFFATIHPEDVGHARRTFEQAIRSQTLSEVEFRRILPGQDMQWLRAVGRMLPASGDRPARVVGVVRNITLQKLAEDAREASEKSYRDIIDSIDGIIWEADHEKNRITYISDSSNRILGYSPQQWVQDATFWERHILPEDAPVAIATYENATMAGRSYSSSYRMVAADGRPIWLHEVVSVITRNSQTKLLRGVMIDITKLKDTEAEYQQASEQFAESESRLKAILDTAAVGIVTVDNRLNVTRFNREAEKIFGYSAEEMIGSSLDRLIPEDLRPKHNAHMRRFLLGEAHSQLIGDWRFINGLGADGRSIPLDIVISKVSVAGKVTLTAIMRDMSEAKIRERELQQLLIERESALDKAETANRAKSSFLAVMSHELRTPLNAIIGFSDLMRNEAFGSMANAHYRQYAIDINESGQLLLTILNSILDLSRIESGKQELDIVPLRFNECWSGIASTMESMAAQKDIRLRINPDEAISFLGDRHAVAQILMNLVGNAIKFTPRAGLVSVTLLRARERQEAVLMIEDTGRGIPADRLADVLQPFVQVSDSYVRDVGGVGLGLAICKSLAESMSGRISIGSELGKGTCVQVFLPLM